MKEKKAAVHFVKNVNLKELLKDHRDDVVIAE